MTIGWLVQWIQLRLSSAAAAIMFYTRLPVPSRWCSNFDRVARYAPSVGPLIGGILAGLDSGLLHLSMPTATRSAIIVLIWIWLTGGLHLDGVLDTADGLAVPDAQRRLQVMADSRVGAFGAIAGASLIALKVVALGDITQHRGAVLMLVAGWGRWGQQVAIARYPYLKAEGKGAMHKSALPSVWSTLPSLALLLALHWLTLGSSGLLWLGSAALSGGIAWGTGAWIDRRLGGHTGDTYGAVVEWTEAIALAGFAALLA
ncbi:MAG: adenosylcobinamide-GDP ribazoletransferase [Cyanobacteria bacterium P01_A01_bin.135]